MHNLLACEERMSLKVKYENKRNKDNVTRLVSLEIQDNKEEQKKPSYLFLTKSIVKLCNKFRKS